MGAPVDRPKRQTQKKVEAHVPAVDVPDRRVVPSGEGPFDQHIRLLRHEEFHGHGGVLLDPVHDEGAQVVRTPQHLQARNHATSGRKKTKIHKMLSRQRKGRTKVSSRPPRDVEGGRLPPKTNAR